MAKQLRGHSRTFFAVLFAVLVLVTTLVSANVVLGQDATPPAITKSISGELQFTSGGNTCITSATALRVNVEDADSGVKSCSIAVTDSSNKAVLAPSCTSGDNDFTLPNSLPDGAYTISATATDNAGNTLPESATGNDPMTVFLDNTGPQLTKTIGSPQFGTNPTFVKSTTPIKVDATDPDSGVDTASCILSGDTQNNGAYTLLAEFTLTTQDGSKTFTVTCKDKLGNEGSLTEVVVVDDTAPTIEIKSPSGVYILNQQVVASYSCDDGAGSGIASCVGDLSNSTIIDTSSAALGSHAFTVTAIDNLGNTASTSADYSVEYSQICGRKVLTPLQQVSDPAQLTKTYKSGRTVPVKFQLCDEKGAFIGAAKATLALYDANGVQVAVKNSGNSNGGTDVFRYDPVAQQYIYNLSTKNLSQGIYKIVITVDDGTEISTYFRLGK